MDAAVFHKAHHHAARGGSDVHRRIAVAPQITGRMRHVAIPIFARQQGAPPRAIPADHERISQLLPGKTHKPLMRRTVYQQRGPLQGRAPKEVAACNKSTTMTSWVAIERGPDEPGPSEKDICSGALTAPTIVQLRAICPLTFRREGRECGGIGLRAHLAALVDRRTSRQ